MVFYHTSMRKNFPDHTLAAIVIIMIAFMAMGCDEDSGNKSPSASLTVEPRTAWIFNNATIENPEITFNASGSRDPDGEIANYHYDYGEGNFSDLGEDTTQRTYTVAGFFTTGLTVDDNDGDESSTTESLTINYQYRRTEQIIDSTTGASGAQEHFFPVSEYHPDTALIQLNITAPDLGSPPTANLTVYNAENEEVDRQSEQNIQGNTTLTIRLDKQDFDNFGYGEWKVVVECENGSYTYDLLIQVEYKK